MFSPPFKSYSFDGLVTFTNTQGALSRDEGGATVIDGGFISANTIEVGSLKTEDLDTRIATVASELVVGGVPNDIDTGVDDNGNARTGARTVITLEGIEVYDGVSTNPRVKLGDLS